MAPLLGAGSAPAVIYFANAFYGAALPLPALVLFGWLWAILVAHLASSARRKRLDELSPGWAVAGLFATVLLIAALTLTPWLPGGVHPIWAWSGAPPASTLDRSATSLEILKLLGLAAPFLLGCLYGSRTDTGRRLYGVVLGLGAIYALASLVVFLSVAFARTSGNRLTGGFESANIAGSLFGVLLILSIAWGYRAWNRFGGFDVSDRLSRIAPAGALMLLFLLCLLLTASRGAMAATGLALALFIGWAALDNRQARWPMALLGVLVILVAAVVYTQGATLFVDRFGQLGDGNASRTNLLAPHWRAFLDAPLFGSGLGTFPQVNNQIMTSQNFAALSETIILHNVYVQWLEEAGVVGAAPMILLVALILGATAWRAFNRSRNRTLVMGLLLASLVLLAHASVDVALNTPSVCAFWSLLMGLGFALSQASRRPG